MWGCSVLLCAGVWAPGPRPPLPLYIQFRAAPRRATMVFSTAQRTGWLLFLRQRDRRGFTPRRPSKARPPLPVWGADGYQMAGEERGRRGPIRCLRFALFFLPLHRYSSPHCRFQANCCPVMQDWKRNPMAVQVSLVISVCFYTVGAADSQTGAVMIHLTRHTHYTVYEIL